MFGQLIFDILCWFWVAPIDWLGKETGKSAEAKYVSINNICSANGCNAMRYEDSIYCLRHKPSEESKEETQPEENWWEDEKD